VTLHELYQRLHGPPEDADRAARELAESGRRVVVVSACLLGEKTRYDGGDKHHPKVVDPLLADPEVAVLPLCPEILGGMGCPRPSVSFRGGDGDTIGALGVFVIDEHGEDRTAALDQGARRAAELAALAGAASAILKEKSPSCGPHLVHRDGEVTHGRGAFAARLGRVHLRVLSEEDVLQKGSR
jgi:uncharacterized protein YbbK (DUF523 family)